VLVARDPKVLERAPIVGAGQPIASDPSRRVWSDDFNNLFRAMKKPRSDGS
jgi:hypothetical protein